MRRHDRLWMVLLAVAVVSASGCSEGLRWGGGWMLSNDGVSKANFGFNVTRCGELLEGHLNYHDRSAVGYASAGGVKLNGPVTEVLLCPRIGASDPDCSACPASSAGTRVLARFDYRSTNPKLPGQGRVVACVINRGGDMADAVGFEVQTGPFAGYSNSGVLQGGSIEQASCPGSE
jgi:hypothetical protein